jgi:ribosomal protein L18
MNWTALGEIIGGTTASLCAALGTLATVFRSKRATATAVAANGSRADAAAMKFARETYERMLDEQRESNDRLARELAGVRTALDELRARYDNLERLYSEERAKVRALAQAARDAGLPVPGAED